jgi:hypothetical protein
MDFELAHETRPKLARLIEILSFLPIASKYK